MLYFDLEAFRVCLTELFAVFVAFFLFFLS